MRALAEQVLPRWVFERIRAIRSRQWQVSFLRHSGLLTQVKKHIACKGLKVLDGPFAGMTYPPDSALIRWCVPKLVGSYEKELHPFLFQAGMKGYDCVIDIGSAEGYYACGLARMLNIPVYAYDPEPKEKAFTLSMAKLNNVVHLVKAGNLFTPSDMKEFSLQRALVVCDCEGFEETLFTPTTLELTRRWDLLIELHGSAEQVLPALQWPHKTQVIPIQNRKGEEDEYRPGRQSFLVCEAMDS
jgi:hypothetical protein